MFKTIISSFMFSLLSVCILNAQPQGAPGTDAVYPVTVNPFTLPQSTEHSILSQTPERGPVPDPGLLDRIMNQVLPVNPNDPTIQSVVGGQQQSLAPIYIWNSFTGPNQNGWVPADVDIAQGGGTYAGWTIIVTNEQFHIYSNSTHTQLYTNTLQNWFSSSADTVTSVFDPKVIYDDWCDRWVMLALARSPSRSFYYLSISQTSSPTGAWWNYKLNAHVDGSTGTTFWADYPGLGFSNTGAGISGGCVAICSNQYNTSNSFQYAKVRLLKTSQLYIGGGVSWYDFWNYSDADAQKAFTWQPARQIWSTTNANIYMLNTRWSGSSFVTLWRVDNPTGVTPTITRQATVTTVAYSIPPAAPSLGGGTVDAFDCRTQNVWYMNGSVYSAWVSSFNWGSGNNAIVHYARINVGTNAVVRESRFGSNGIWFMHPSVVPEYMSPYTNGHAGLQFATSSSTAYPSHCVIGDDGAVISSYSIISGNGSLGTGLRRYGDYGGITYDDAQTGVFWSAGMLAHAGSWGTGAFRFSFSAPPSGIHNQNGEVPSAYQLYQNYPNPFNPVTKIEYGIPASGMVNMTVYDVLGREVAVVVNDYQKAGFYETTFDASSLPSGIYIYRITSGNFTESKKMTLVK